jgi:hypothetical protein
MCTGRPVRITGSRRITRISTTRSMIIATAGNTRQTIDAMIMGRSGDSLMSRGYHGWIPESRTTACTIDEANLRGTSTNRSYVIVETWQRRIHLARMSIVVGIARLAWTAITLGVSMDETYNHSKKDAPKKDPTAHGDRKKDAIPKEKDAIKRDTTPKKSQSAHIDANPTLFGGLLRSRRVSPTLQRSLDVGGFYDNRISLINQFEHKFGIIISANLKSHPAPTNLKSHISQI